MTARNDSLGMEKIRLGLYEVQPGDVLEGCVVTKLHRKGGRATAWAAGGLCIMEDKQTVDVEVHRPRLELGEKLDDSKARWDLLPWGPLAEVVSVLTYGARKYRPDNWQHVPDARARYTAAMMRHVSAWAQGEGEDPESGCSHLAHAVCCGLFLMWFDARGER